MFERGDVEICTKTNLASVMGGQATPSSMRRQGARPRIRMTIRHQIQVTVYVPRNPEVTEQVEMSMLAPSTLLKE